MTTPDRPTPVRPVAYKGEPLDAERGPGLGCFRFQLGLLLLLVVLTPLSVAWDWPPAASAVLLFLTLILLLFAGQTVIFLLRLVAAERGEGRRRPRASATRTVGELEDELAADDATTGSSTPGDATMGGVTPTDAPTGETAAGTDGPAAVDSALGLDGAWARPSDAHVRE